MKVAVPPATCRIVKKDCAMTLLIAKSAVAQDAHAQGHQVGDLPAGGAYGLQRLQVLVRDPVDELGNAQLVQIVRRRVARLSQGRRGTLPYGHGGSFPSLVPSSPWGTVRCRSTAR